MTAVCTTSDELTLELICCALEVWGNKLINGVTGDWGVDGIAAAGIEWEGWSTVGVMLLLVTIRLVDIM